MDMTRMPQTSETLSPGLPPLGAPEAMGPLTPVRLRERVADLTAELVACRRDFHRWPELSFREVHTAARIASELHTMGLEVQTGVAKTGVVGLLRGGRSAGNRSGGKTLLVRADIDALPLDEQNDVSYRSRNPGVMHACGHDAHMAMLLTAIRVLAERRESLPGNLKFVFQPAEEGPGGADLMIEEGVLENPRVDAAIGFHIWNELPVGVVGVRPGPLMASSDEFEIVIEGQGTHAADPHLGVDAVVVAAHVLTALQTIVSRSVSPLESAVLSVGKIVSGSAHNVIAQTAHMSGTVRTFNEELRATMPRRIEQLIQGVAMAFGATARLEYRYQYPVLSNAPEMAALVRTAAERALGAERVVTADATMGAEDMAYFLREVPGCYFLIGSANSEKGLDKPHHHPQFDIDEDALPVGVQAIVQAVLDYLAD
ncbi:putative hydrolase YxeP [compost metagenome]